MHNNVNVRRKRTSAEQEINLKVLKPGLTRHGVRSRRASVLLFVWFSTIIMIFGAAVITNLMLRARLTQVEMDENQLTRQIEEEKKLTSRIELELAQLKNPERILTIAVNNIGMVKPNNISYLKKLSDRGIDLAQIDNGLKNQAKPVEDFLIISSEPISRENSGFIKYFKSTLIFMFP